MEPEPPALPPQKPPPGPGFYYILLTPLVLISLGFCCLGKNFDGKLGGPVLSFAALGALVASIALAVQLARRSGKEGKSNIGIGILTFFGLLFFYGVCAFVGCTTTVMFS